MDEIPQLHHHDNPLSVAAVIKRADDRLYRTLMFAPLLARLLYAMCVAVVAITVFVMKTRWDIADLYRDKEDKSSVVLQNTKNKDADDVQKEHSERNAKLVDQIYRDLYKREPPPR